MKEFPKTSSGKNADFHTHSNYSTDGTKSIKQLLKRAHKNNTTMLGVTDHNTITGVNKFLDKLNIDRNNVMELVNGKTILVPGTEITARISEIKNLKGKSTKLHLIVYGIDRYDDSPISKLLKIKSINDRHIDLGFIDQIIKQYNVNITNQDILDYIMYCNRCNNEVKGFGKSETIDFIKFLGLDLAENDQQLIETIDKFSLVERLNLEVKDVINLVHASGGIVLLAHPNVNLRRTKHSKDVISYLIENEIDGFEMYYPQNTKESDIYLRRICKENKINLFSGGSDYHDDKPYTNDKHYITYEPITLDKVSAFIDYMNEIKTAREKGTLILKNYKNLRDFNVEETLEKYRQRFCIIEDIHKSTPFEEISELEL